MGVGAWKLALRVDTPRRVLDRLDPRVNGFGQLVILPAPLPGGPKSVSEANLLARARYAGVLRKQTSDTAFAGCGLNVYMGDEDGKGIYDASLSVASPYGFDKWAAALRPSFLTAGITSTISGVYNNTYTYKTRKTALADVCNRFEAEWRVNPNFTFDIGLQADLFLQTPKSVILPKGGGRELGVRGIPGDLQVARDVEDWARRVVMLSGAGPTATAADGSVADADVQYRAPDGKALQWVKVFNAPSTVPAGSETPLATVEYFRNASARQEFTLSTEHYDIGADIRVGDMLYVYDESRGIRDLTSTVIFNGEVLRPEIIRCVGYSWPLSEGMGVYFRFPVDNNTDTWTFDYVDLTEFVIWEDGETTVEVGAIPRPTS